ncbi:hypothetical protein [Actinoplanes regularis]|uniref:hypothetical protein n=1 Tax=Actinoplanes regularis TaxID=52697 RepID=UPI000B798EA6|nr:hypothetical protein [Actinoplanes regularis]GIE90935.1 hypothetical protein Are01nite_74150 [Actinoplanes regularis]
MAAVAGAPLRELAAVYLPALRDLPGTQPVDMTDLLIVGAAASRLDRLIRPPGTSGGRPAVTSGP